MVQGSRHTTTRFLSAGEEQPDCGQRGDKSGIADEIAGKGKREREGLTTAGDATARLSAGEKPTDCAQHGRKWQIATTVAGAERGAGRGFFGQKITWARTPKFKTFYPLKCPRCHLQVGPTENLSTKNVRHGRFARDVDVGAWCVTATQGRGCVQRTDSKTRISATRRQQRRASGACP